MSIIEHVRSLNVAIRRSNIPITSNPSHYIITPSDYRRFNSVDSSFKMKLYLPVLRAFDCRCALCGCDSEGIEMDHFFLPKAQGGNYILTRTDHSRVLNAVPLCISCNRHKSATPAFSSSIPLSTIETIITTLRDLMAVHLGHLCPHSSPANLLRLKADDAVTELLSKSWPKEDEWIECEAFLKGEPNRLQEMVDEMVGWDEEYEKGLGVPAPT